MPRPRRYEFQGAFYHVYSRGNRRETIYRETDDFEKFEGILFEKAQISEIQLWGWCLMPNHFHMLVSTPQANLNVFMRRLLTSYALWFNKRHQLTGHVFESRYKARICDHDAYLLQLIKYIHLNPVRTRKHTLVQKLEDWKWSSHRFYLSPGAPEYVQKFINLILRRFGAGQLAWGNYQKFIKEGLNIGQGGAFEGMNANGFLGNPLFIDEIKNRFEVDRVKKGLSGDHEIKSIDILGEKVAEVLEVSPADLRSLNKERKLSRVRYLLMYLAKKYFRFTTTELGQYLNRDASTISHALHRMDDQIEKAPELEILRKALFKSG
ncbi:MAG: Chromosomal replication initiator protein DnaA [Elusimicrobia bacterium]|nr:Chromosomal replication initiator protein DnaA [Elusimicrobiota bacterium]MCG3205371.1 Chromosomal replication initiator protein DnaA [Elusimicrobiota bacterium]